MSDDRIVGERYAKAAYAAAAGQNAQDALNSDFQLAAQLLRDNPALFKLLTNPVLPYAEKASIVNTVFSAVLSLLSVQTILLLIRKNRMRYFFAVARSINDQFNEAQNRVDVRAVSAMAMPQTTQEQIVVLLRKTLGKEIVLHCEIDPALLGGVQLHVGDRVIDGSVQYQLRQMAARLVTM